MEVTDLDNEKLLEKLSIPALFVLNHCFVGDAKDFAKKELRESLLDSEAQIDLDKDAELQEKYGGVNRRRKIKNAAFDRNYIIENINKEPIHEFLIDNLTIGEIDRKHDDSSSLVGGSWYTYIDDVKKVWLHDLAQLFPTKVIQSFRYNVNNKKALVDKIKAHGLEYKTFGWTGADYAEGMLHEIEEELAEIVEFLKDFKEDE